jgi:hypothetical protein
MKKYILILLLAVGCAPQNKLPKKRGHWQYTHDEEMQWVNDSTSKQKP